MDFSIVSKLDRTQIDDNHWDNCVINAPNGEVFALSWFMDAVFPEWQGFVLGDYQAVMPNFARRKWGIPLLKTPYFVKWIDIYPYSEVTRLGFMTGLAGDMKRVLSLDYHLRFKLSDSFGRTPSSEGVQILELNGESDLPGRELKKNLRIAASHSPFLQPDVSWLQYEQFIRMYFPYPMKESAMQILHRVWSEGKKRHVAGIYGATIEGELVAVQLFFNWNGTLYLMQNAVSPGARSKNIMAWLIQTLIENHRKLNLTRVHFMGSNNTAVAQFNSKFGARTIHYFRYRAGFNR